MFHFDHELRRRHVDPILGAREEAASLPVPELPDRLVPGRVRRRDQAGRGQAARVLRQAARHVPLRERQGQRPRRVLPAPGRAPRPRRPRRRRERRVPIPCMEVRHRRRVHGHSLFGQGAAALEPGLLAGQRDQRPHHGVARHRQAAARVGGAQYPRVLERRVDHAAAARLEAAHPQPGDRGERRRQGALPLPARHAEHARHDDRVGRTRST
jgi:hypothetical protein